MPVLCFLVHLWRDATLSRTDKDRLVDFFALFEMMPLWQLHMPVCPEMEQAFTAAATIPWLAEFRDFALQHERRFSAGQLWIAPSIENITVGDLQHIRYRADRAIFEPTLTLGDVLDQDTGKYPDRVNTFLERWVRQPIRARDFLAEVHASLM